MFGAKKLLGSDKGDKTSTASGLLVYAPDAYNQDAALNAALEQGAAPWEVHHGDVKKIGTKSLGESAVVLALHQTPEVLSQLAEVVSKLRNERKDGTPVLIIGVAPEQLTAFGDWLHTKAKAGGLSGIRLSLNSNPAIIAREVAHKGVPIPMAHTNVIAMPTSTEVETVDYKYLGIRNTEWVRWQGRVRHVTRKPEWNVGNPCARVGS